LSWKGDGDQGETTGMADGPGVGIDDFVPSRSTGLLRVAYLLTGDRYAVEACCGKCSSG